MEQKPHPTNIFQMPVARAQAGQDSPEVRPASTRRGIIHNLERRLRDDRPDDCPDLIEQLRLRRPTFRDEVAEALADPSFTFFLGGFVGVALTCVSAVIAAGVFK